MAQTRVSNRASHFRGLIVCINSRFHYFHVICFAAASAPHRYIRRSRFKVKILGCLLFSYLSYLSSLCISRSDARPHQQPSRHTWDATIRQIIHTQDGFRRMTSCHTHPVRFNNNSLKMLDNCQRINLF